MPIYNPNLPFNIEPIRRRQAPDPFWAGTPPSQPKDSSVWWKVLAATAGTVGFGMAPVGAGHGLDIYYKTARWFEQRTPGAVFKTFGVSNLIFPFTRYAPQGKGLVAEAGGKLAQGLRAVYPGRLQEFKVGSQEFVNLPGLSKFGKAIAIPRAYASSQMQRFNALLEEVRELNILKPIPGFERAQAALSKPLSKLGLTLPEHVLGVKPGPALKMFGGFTAKAAAMGIGIHYLGYLDYLRREEDNKLITGAGGALAGAAYFGAFFRNLKATKTGAIVGAAVGLLPAFDEGIYAGFAGLYTKGRLLYTKFSDITGLTSAAQKQEELAPGITKPTTALGFAGAGGLTAYLGAYAGRLAGLKGATEIGSHMFMKGGLVGLGIYAGLAGLAAIASGTYIPGILGSDTSYEDLKAIYSGEKRVPVRKGRWWEFGRTPWEGTKVDYYRMHWYPRLLSGARDISLYGSEKEKWDYDPSLHPIKALFDEEFKYHRELKNYHTRPYPITGTYFEDIPFLGPILAGTIGKFIKPTRYMHTEQWLRGGQLGEPGAETYNVPHAGEHEPISEFGGIPGATPEPRYNTEDIIGKTIYRLNELRGLTGFAHGAIKEHLTGSQDYFDEARRLESASRAYGLERWYWDLNLGGLLGTTEAVRRYIPHRRRQIELYNPIPNLMPSWMPGSNYYIDFRTGDPFTKVPEGEIRLPGRGYESLHPELKGLHPEEYPLFHRFKILADVAMWSEEYKTAKAEMREAQKQGRLSNLELQQFRSILSEVSTKKKKRTFKEYQFAASDAVKTEVTIKGLLPSGTFTTEEFSNVEFQLAGVNLSAAAVDRLARQKEIEGTLKSRVEEIKQSQYNTLEKSLQAGQKISVLIPRDPLNRYKLGVNTIKMPVVVPGLNTGLIEEGLAEYQEGPLSQYVKYTPMQRGFATAWEIITHKGETPLELITPLAPMTKFVHARSAIEEYERTQVFGTQSAFWQHPIEHFIKPFTRSVMGTLDSDYIPEDIQSRRQLQDYFDRLKYVKYTRLEKAAREAGATETAEELATIKRQTLFGVDPYGNFANILKALPGAERDFFTAFSNATTPEERERILQVIPASERPIYLARWHGRLAKQMIAERRSDITQDLTLLAQLSRLKKSEGRPYTPELIRTYEKERRPDQSYADWYREQELESYFMNAPLPGPNWIGWHPKVDLDDVKLKVIDTLGEDMHDYGLWQSQARTLDRKPYINQDVMKEVFENQQFTREQIADRLRDLLTAHNVGNLDITSHYIHKSYPETEIDIELIDDQSLTLQEYVEDPNRE